MITGAGFTQLPNRKLCCYSGDLKVLLKQMEGVLSSTFQHFEVICMGVYESRKLNTGTQ